MKTTMKKKGILSSFLFTIPSSTHTRSHLYCSAVSEKKEWKQINQIITIHLHVVGQQLV